MNSAAVEYKTERKMNENRKKNEYSKNRPDTAFRTELGSDKVASSRMLSSCRHRIRNLPSPAF